jgi:hypothetical protein
MGPLKMLQFERKNQNWVRPNSKSRLRDYYEHIDYSYMIVMKRSERVSALLGAVGGDKGRERTKEGPPMSWCFDWVVGAHSDDWVRRDGEDQGVRKRVAARVSLGETWETEKNYIMKRDWEELYQPSLFNLCWSSGAHDINIQII